MIIKKNPKNPEVICVKLNDDEIAVCGLATVDVMKNNSSLDLILDPFLKKKGTKTGFCGFEHLIPFSNLDELKSIISSSI